MAEHNGLIWMTSSSSGEIIVLYDASSFEFVGSFVADSKRIFGITSLPTYSCVCTFSLNNLRLWKGEDPTTLQCVRTMNIQSGLTATMTVIYEEDQSARLLAGNLNGEIISYDPHTGHPLQELVNDLSNDPQSPAIVHLLQYANTLVVIALRSVTLWPNIYNFCSQ